MTALVKFGPDDAKLVHTTCKDGQFEPDEEKGTIEALPLQTIRGCCAIKMGGGGGVMLNDAEFRIFPVPAKVY